MLAMRARIHLAGRFWMTYSNNPTVTEPTGHTQLANKSIARMRLLLTLLRDLSYALLTFLG